MHFRVDIWWDSEKPLDSKANHTLKKRQPLGTEENMKTEIEKMVELLQEEIAVQTKEVGKFSTEVSTLRWCLWRAEELVNYQNLTKYDEQRNESKDGE